MRKILITVGLNIMVAMLCASAYGIIDTAGAAEAADQDHTAGSVKNVKGEAFILRGGQRAGAEVGARLYAQDVLQTGKNGSMGIILRDDTTMAIGPSSQLNLKEFVFRPREGLFSSITGLVKGTLVYITGKIAKLSPKAVSVETPVGIIAVRGTKIMVQVD
jgi:hypothetical protein